ncbi:MAG: pyridoxamine 5'-phosphate oxidase family protein [Hyphomonadaceae bacterium]
MTQITSIEALEALYQPALPASLAKVMPRLTPLYTKWIEAARFVILSTVGPEGTDASPRGDDGPVVEIIDPQTLLLPDWRGNNRLDSLRNIVRDPRVSLMFLIAGCNNTVRINGKAALSTAPDLIHRFDKAGKHPASIIIIKPEEVYFQCAKALMRSALWQPDPNAAKPPTAGEFVRELQEGFDAESYDAGYADYAKDKMW